MHDVPIEFQGSADTTVSSADQIGKLLRLIETSMRTGTYELLKGCQVVRGQRSFISKWSIITRMTGWCKSDQEFAFASIQICWQLLPEKQPKEFSRSFSKLNIVSLSRDGLKEVCGFFSFLLELLGQLISEHKLSDEDPLASMYHGYQQDFLDCERFAARSHVSQGTRGVVPSALEVLAHSVPEDPGIVSGRSNNEISPSLDPKTW